MKDPIAIGKILSPFGIKGEVKVLPLTGDLSRFENLRTVWTERGKLEVEKGRIHGRGWVLKFAGIDNRDQAGELQEMELFIPREERQSLPQGHYYYDQLIGLEVFSEAGEHLGRIMDILPSGGQDIYVAVKEGGRGEILIPAVKEIVKLIDLPGGRVIIDPPDGLLDLYPGKEGKENRGGDVS